MRMLVTGLIAVLLTGPAAEAQEGAPPGSSWYVIETTDGSRIGHAWHAVEPRDDGLASLQGQEITVREEGAATATRMATRTVRTEDSTGRTVSIETTTVTGANRASDIARISGGVARITRTTALDSRESIVVLPDAVRFDGGEPLLATWDPAITPKLSFERLNIEAQAVERVVLEPGPDGSVVRRSYQGEALMGVARLELDAARRVSVVTQPMFGATVRIRPASRETALAAHPPFRVLASVTTRSPVRITDAALGGRLRYDFTFREGLEFPLPQTGEQRVQASPGAARVDVCADCGPGMADDAAALTEALAPTAWLQSDHPRILAMAEPVARRGIPQTAKMEALVALTRPYVEELDFAGHYSALETLGRRRGDCTEAAVLLAALGRAAGIPTRVVNGVVYSRALYHGVSNSFLPHSWVLAYVDGRWRSYDAALPAFDAGHIALSIGDGDPRSIAAASQLAGLLEWQAVSEVRARPAQ